MAVSRRRNCSLTTFQRMVRLLLHLTSMFTQTLGPIMSNLRNRLACARQGAASRLAASLHQSIRWTAMAGALAVAACSGASDPDASLDASAMNDAVTTFDGALDATYSDAGVADGNAVDGNAVDANPEDASAVDGFQPGPVGCEGLDLEAYRSTDCFCADACECFLGIPYGLATWTEGIEREQLIDVFLPLGADATPMPLVVWAHPNGSTRDVGENSALAVDVAVPLLAEGTAFASVEFRHPYANAGDGAPRTDLADAIQYLRCHSRTLGTSRERMAAVARSRGTLAIWTALQDDLADPASPEPARRESTRLRGVFGVQAQTSYWGEWIAATFFSEASQPLALERFRRENLGHAVGDVSADDPPVAMIYRDPLETLPLDIADCNGGTV
ncbi:MAG: hypothetical protein ACI9KE_005771, partial [Polyangiales bacterium]